MKVVLVSVAVILGCAALAASDETNPLNLPNLPLIIQKICEKAGKDDQATVDKFFGCYDMAKVTFRK